MHWHSLDHAPVAGKVVLVRADLNVPIVAGKIADMNRIRRSVPTLKTLIEKGARVVVLSHFDRPGGKYVPSMSLAPIADALGEALGQYVKFGVDCIGKPAEEAVRDLQSGEVVLLENLRFHAEEEANDPAFAGALAALGDVYVNDAFSCSHRAHASVVGITQYLPAYAGHLMAEELSALGAALQNPKRPVTAIVGGAKISSKLALLENLIEKVDALVIGGGMANTFLHAQGVPVGASLCEKDLQATASAILAKAKARGCAVLLPVDVVVVESLSAHAPCRVVSVAEVQSDDRIVEVGPESVEAIAAQIRLSHTLVWNGPLGVFETTPFDAATVSVMRVAASRTRAGLLKTVAGGGDTVSAFRHAGLEAEVSYLSTAGGAFLEWLEGRELPGVKALEISAKKVA